MFPVYAGMNRRIVETAGLGSDVPRVCGDEPHGRLFIKVPGICSPCMRG